MSKLQAEYHADLARHQRKVLAGFALAGAGVLGLAVVVLVKRGDKKEPMQ